MFNPYRELFAAPGRKALVLAGLIARLPLPMTGIGIITLLAQLSGSYALAGAVAATFVMTYALLSPQISRLVDRYGQRRVLPGATVLSVMGVLILLAGIWLEAPIGVLFAGAVLAGCMPSMSAMVRARWTTIYRGQAQLQTAYSLETVLDELTFVAGPPLAIGLSIAVLPQAGLLAAAALLSLGVALLLVQRSSEPPVIDRVFSAQRPVSVIRRPEVGLLTLLMIAMGVIVGTVDIVSVAFAEQQGMPGAASLVLSAYAIGSCLAGLLFGALQLQISLPRLLLLGGTATALSTLPLLLVDNIAALAAAVFIAGWFFAPSMIVAMSLVERLVPSQQFTEGMTWLLAGLNVGVALGAFAAGQVVESAGVQAGFDVALYAAMLVFLLALFCSTRLTRDTRLACSEQVS